MRILLLVIWILIPVGFVAYHLGPGQNQMRLDEASQVLIEADELITEAKWSAAQVAIEKALALVPEDRKDLRYKLQLQRARVQMNNAQLPDANEELKSLVDSLASESESYPELEQEARLALANSHYYMTWLKRREGLSRDEWEPNVLAAQQNLRLLADSARRDNRSSDLERYQKDLEATVRLARLDLGELQGLPLPSQ